MKKYLGGTQDFVAQSMLAPMFFMSLRAVMLRLLCEVICAGVKFGVKFVVLLVRLATLMLMLLPLMMLPLLVRLAVGEFIVRFFPANIVAPVASDGVVSPVGVVFVFVATELELEDPSNATLVASLK